MSGDMEPQVSYVTSADGTRIAMWTIGAGRPLVLVASTWLSSIASNWQIPAYRTNVERLAAKRMVVQYDARGTGLSQREIDDLSMEARVNDLAAVINRLDSEQVDLLAAAQSCYTGIPYVASHAHQIRRFIVAGGAARGRDFRISPERRALSSLIEVNWELYLQTMMLVEFGWEFGQAMFEANRDTLSKEMYVANWQEIRGYDVTELLASIECPTLVIRSRETNQGVPLEATKEYAARLSNSRLVIIDTKTLFLLSSESPAYVEALEAFLDEGEPAKAVPALPSGTAVILFLDIAGSTALTESMGDAAFRTAARSLDNQVRSIIESSGGTAIDGKVLGDGVMAVFGSAGDAIQAALRCNLESRELQLHLGIHAGDVIRDGSNVYGGAVNVASRVCGLSAPGELLVSETVRSLARTSTSVRFEDRGVHEVKGVGEPVHVWSVTAS